jgi:putative NIF3 family GTP cyclohydrolase 1 type 2
MKAREILDHFREVGAWVDWEKTCDRFLHGDPETEVGGIATAWTTTNASVRRAAERGLDLYVCHEPCWYASYETKPGIAEMVAAKKRLLDELDVVVLRCHDTWDRMPEVGIPDAWAEHLGFETEPRDPLSYYKTCLVGGRTVEDLASEIKDRVRPLGQDTVLVFGDRTRVVERMAVGTGAITRLPDMTALAPDVILATDDGFNWWDGGLWAADSGMPLLVLNHATAEKPGMMAMARYLAELYPSVPVEYVDVEYPYKSV